MSGLTLSRDELLDGFTTGPAKLTATLEGLPESALDLSLTPGEWTIRQIVHHISDDGDVWCMALKKAIATPGAPIRFESFPGNDAWATALDFHTRPVAPALALIHAHGQVMAELLNHFPGAWDNCIAIVDAQEHEIRKVSVGDMVGFLDQHLEDHIHVIESIKQRHHLQSNQMHEVIVKLAGANMDIDLATPPDQIAWAQALCPWNESEQTNAHKCAVKNISICPHFRGVEYLDTLVCSYPRENLFDTNSSQQVES